jgi:hypothetical protein
MAILPGRARGGRSVADAPGLEPPPEDAAIGAVSITNEIFWRLIPWKSLSYLPSDPLGRRIRGDIGPYKLPTSQMKNDKPMEQLEADRRYDEEVDSGNLRRMIAQKGLPVL